MACSSVDLFGSLGCAPRFGGRIVGHLTPVVKSVCGGSHEIRTEKRAYRHQLPNCRPFGKLTRCSEPIRCATEHSKIVHSVRIGPPQPKSFMYGPETSFYRSLRRHTFTDCA